MVSVTRRPGCHRVAGIRHFFKKNIKKADQVKQNKKKKPFLFFLFFLLCGKWVNSPAGTILSLRCCGNTHAFGLEGGSFVWEAVASPMLWHGTYLTSAFFFSFSFSFVSGGIGNLLIGGRSLLRADDLQVARFGLLNISWSTQRSGGGDDSDGGETTPVRLNSIH